MDIATVDELLSTTRSVRRRLDLTRPVEREVLLECVRLAMQAPTGGNQQGWRFLFVTDPERRAALAELYRAGGVEYLRAAAEAAKDDQTRRVYESAVYLADVLHEVPVHLVPCIKGRVDGAAAGGAAAGGAAGGGAAWLSPAVVSGFYASIVPAVWSFMLAARARGLGTVWTSLHLNREREAAEILGLPADVTQVALVPVAYYTGESFRPAARPPAETVTYWDTWKNTAG